MSDNQTQSFDYYNYYYFPNDTVKYHQNQNTGTVIKKLFGQLAITSNKDNAYIKNVLLFQNSSLPSTSRLDANGVAFEQNLLQNNKNLSNEFNIIKTKNKTDILEFYSYINYLSKPESLKVNNGIFPDFFNDSINYNQLAQTVDIPTYFNNSYFSYRHTKLNFFQNYKLGVSNEWQHLKTQTLVTDTDNIVRDAYDSSINNFNWQKSKIYALADYDWVSKKSKLSIHLPISWQSMDYVNKLISNGNKVFFQQFFFDPTINIKYFIAPNSYFIANYGFSNQLSTIEEICRGFVLNNINQLTNFQIPIKKDFIQNLNVGINLKNPVKILFFNLNASYTNINHNSILSSLLFKDLQEQSIIQYKNNVNNISINSELSTYSFKLHTTITFSSTWGISQSHQIENGNLLSYDDYKLGVLGRVNPRITDWVNVDFTSSFNTMQSRSNQKFSINSSTNQTRQIVGINIVPKKDYFITIKFEDYNVSQNNLNSSSSFFSDFSFRYKFKKQKIDLFLSILNLANTKRYTVINLNANSFSKSTYNLRPRMALLKIFFNF